MRLKQRAMERARAASILLGLFAAACAAVAEPVTIEGERCEFEAVIIDATFEGGGLAACRERRPGNYVLAIRPETTPINPSPWYAMDIVSNTRRKVTVTLDYGDHKHRYLPDIWTEEKGWRRFDGKVHLKDDGHLASFSLKLPKSGKLRLAAQPLIIGEDTAGWMRAIADETAGSSFATFGRSVEGRSIFSLETGADLQNWLLIIGRQHPPETTGAVAMEAFMKRLMADDALAQNFRSRIGVLAVPMLNPDGVAGGHWRTESSGKDLNRDWGPFEKIESRLVRDEIERRRAAGKRLVAGLDFHSTTKDVLYTQADDDTEFGWFANAWHEAINARIAEAAPGAAPMQRDAAHNPDAPTYKTWINKEYGVPGITVEFSDEAPQARLDSLGVIAAEELMRLLTPIADEA